MRIAAFARAGGLPGLRGLTFEGVVLERNVDLLGRAGELLAGLPVRRLRCRARSWRSR